MKLVSLLPPNDSFSTLSVNCSKCDFYSFPPVLLLPAPSPSCSIRPVLLPQPGSLHTLNPSSFSPKAFLIKADLNTVLIQLENVTSQPWCYHTCLKVATAATIPTKKLPNVKVVFQSPVCNFQLMMVVPVKRTTVAGIKAILLFM